jgi:hypothetical protein
MFVIKTLAWVWIQYRIQIGIQSKMLDLESINPDQKHFFQYILVKKCLNFTVHCTS